MKIISTTILFIVVIFAKAQIKLEHLHPISGKFAQEINFINPNCYYLKYPHRIEFFDSTNVLQKKLKISALSSIAHDSSYITLNSHHKSFNINLKNYETTITEHRNVFMHKGENYSFIINKDRELVLQELTDTTKLRGIIESKPKFIHVSNQFVTVITITNTIYFIDFEQKKINKIVQPEKKIITSAVNSFGNTLVTFSKKHYTVWNVETGTNLQTSKIRAEGKPTCASISSNNQHIAYGDEFGNIWVSNTLNTRKIEHYTKTKTRVTSIDFKPYSNTFFATLEYYKKTIGINIRVIKPTVKQQQITTKKLKSKKDEFAPQLYISSLNRSVNNSIRTKSNFFKLEGRVFDESGVHQLVINGIDVPFKADGKFVLMVPLSPGKNLVSINATDTRSNKTTKEFNITLMDKNEVEYLSEKARNFLFIIGINEYTTFSKLKNATSDAITLEEKLTSEYKIDSNNVYALYDSMATLENINSNFRKIIKNISPNDNLIIYFAGHGVYDNTLNEGYWIPADAKRGHFTSYYANSLLLKTLNNIPAQHILVLADACFSGSLLASKSRNYLEQAEQYKSRKIITSGRLETVSDGQAGEHSPFATTLISYFETNQSDKMSVSVLELYLKQNFPSNTNQTPRFGTLSGIGDEGGEYILHKKK